MGTGGGHEVAPRLHVVGLHHLGHAVHRVEGDARAACELPHFSGGVLPDAALDPMCRASSVAALVAECCPQEHVPRPARSGGRPPRPGCPGVSRNERHCRSIAVNVRRSNRPWSRTAQTVREENSSGRTRVRRLRIPVDHHLRDAVSGDGDGNRLHHAQRRRTGRARCGCGAPAPARWPSAMCTAPCCISAWSSGEVIGSRSGSPLRMATVDPACAWIA